MESKPNHSQRSFETLENSLFEEWFKHEAWCEEQDYEDLFCKDGLHWTGMPLKAGEKWEIERDFKEQEIWENAFLRPVFLTKDHNTQGDGSGTDTRNETGYDNASDWLYHRFYARYLILLYGITNFDKTNCKAPEFEVASQIVNYWYGDNGFFHAPVVRINLKKIAGTSSCNNVILDSYITNDEDFINKQLDVYKNANLFVCCNGSDWNDWNPSMDFVWRRFNMSLEQEPGYTHLWYSKKYKVIVLQVYHMSMRTVSYQEYYNVIFELERFLQNHPNLFQ